MTWVAEWFCVRHVPVSSLLFLTDWDTISRTPRPSWIFFLVKVINWFGQEKNNDITVFFHGQSNSVDEMLGKLFTLSTVLRCSMPCMLTMGNALSIMFGWHSSILPTTLETFYGCRGARRRHELDKWIVIYLLRFFWLNTLNRHLFNASNALAIYWLIPALWIILWVSGCRGDPLLGVSIFVYLLRILVTNYSS